MTILSTNANMLKDRIFEYIREHGPMSVAEYMSFCLLDPTDGYYPTRDPLGQDGDFITAPEISQMFGEVLGLWVLQTYQDMGAPDSFHLIEMGPGRGIMMSDMIRSLSLAPDILSALNIHMIEASAALEAQQAKSLSDCPVPVFWHTSLATIPEGPTVIIGNEYLDCLPVRQLIQKDPFAGANGWHERVIGIDDDAQQLAFMLSPTPISPTLQAGLPPDHEDAKKDALLEISPSIPLLLDEIAMRFDKHPGRALFIDYGPESTEFGDTLQALKRHKKVGVFSDPGETDLTVRVDFGALEHAAESLGLAVFPSVTQSQFLSQLGIEMRAVTLARHSPDDKTKIARQLHRLMDSEQMGTLFRSVCVQSKSLSTPLGFHVADAQSVVKP